MILKQAIIKKYMLLQKNKKPIKNKYNCEIMITKIILFLIGEKPNHLSPNMRLI